MAEVLRLNHRIVRDKRISTHVALVARAFGASKVYYTGQKDNSMEASVKKIVKKHGGNFEIEYLKGYRDIIKKKNAVHLTMKGSDYLEKLGELKEIDNLLVVVGGEKVPIDVYKLSKYNLSVTKEPHSEVGALAVFLDSLNKQNL